MKKIKLNNKIINYEIINPGGNVTALVIGNNYTNEDKKIINDYILKENLIVEQVGFLSTKENKLDMAGGEFCVNATRCAIWQYLNGREGNIRLRVSGCKKIINGGITKDKNVYAKININKRISKLVEQKDIFNLIKLDGILLVVIDEKSSKKYINELKIDEEREKRILKNMMSNLKTEENAVGIILLENDNTKIKIYPVIWVKTIDTLYYETACGSGSLAATIYKNYVKKSNELEVIQPSGYSMNVKLNISEDYIEYAIISGKII